MEKAYPDNLSELTKRVGERREGKPLWLLKPFRDFSRFASQTHTLADVAVHGANQLRKMPDLVVALGELEDASDDDAIRKRREQEQWTQDLAESASKHIESGFALLHGHLLVGIWGATEAVISDVLVAWISEMPGGLVDAQKKRIRVSMDALLNADPEERVRMVVQSLWDERDTEIDRRGIGKFEQALACVGVDGPIPRSIKDQLFELQQVRNVFAHRAGSADEAFVRSCPAFGLAVGDFVQVDAGRFIDYQTSLTAYMLQTLDRCFDRYEALSPE